MYSNVHFAPKLRVPLTGALGRGLRGFTSRPVRAASDPLAHDAATAGRDFHTSDGDYEVGPTELHGDSVEHFRIVVEPEN